VREDAAQVLRQRLEVDLRSAMKRRDEVAVAALRSVFQAVDNAGAVALTAEHAPTVGRANEVPRRVLEQSEVETLIRREAEVRAAAAGEYRRLGLVEQAERLDAEVRVVLGCLVADGPPAP
jgi:hypothetical protein